jgi:hypothetical protein
LRQPVHLEAQAFEQHSGNYGVALHRSAARLPGPVEPHKFMQLHHDHRHNPAGRDGIGDARKFTDRLVRPGAALRETGSLHLLHRTFTRHARGGRLL